jgi:hypothetical protein
VWSLTPPWDAATRHFGCSPSYLVDNHRHASCAGHVAEFLRPREILAVDSNGLEFSVAQPADGRHMGHAIRPDGSQSRQPVALEIREFGVCEQAHLRLLILLCWGKSSHPLATVAVSTFDRENGHS